MTGWQSSIPKYSRFVYTKQVPIGKGGFEFIFHVSLPEQKHVDISDWWWMGEPEALWCSTTLNGRTRIKQIERIDGWNPANQFIGIRYSVSHYLHLFVRPRLCNICSTVCVTTNLNHQPTSERKMNEIWNETSVGGTAWSVKFLGGGFKDFWIVPWPLRKWSN